MDEKRIYRQPITPVNMPGRSLRPCFRERVSEGEAEGHVVERPASGKKAGVRRRRRFENDYFLAAEDMHNMPQNLEEAKMRWHSLFCPHKESVIQELFEDEAAMAAFEPFLEVTMERQEELLRKFSRSNDRQVEEDEQDKTCPTLRFKEIPKDMRTVLRSCVDSESLPVLESAIVEYLRTAAEAEKTGIKPPALEFRLEGVDRLLIHALAIFYNVHSYSMDVEKEAENAEEGADEDVARMKPTERVTYIKCKRKGVPPLPTKHLTEYLDFVISATGYISYGKTFHRKQKNGKKKYRKRFNTK
uniref:R3H-associated N-terminal domain-containing protein n=1 Tax=Eutreptiella gymnastica TaxID=73025 RepID=A0A7S4FWH9_9EUGL